MAIPQERIDNDFGYHAATPETGPMHDEVRQAFNALATRLNNLLPAAAGRETALVVTNLEQAMFWANAGIARHLAPLS